MKTRLKDLRVDNDLKQETVAKLLQTTQPQYARYENGIREIPIRHLITLCKFYNVSSDYILGLIDSPVNLQKCQLCSRR